MSRGYVYVLSNPAMPGIVKIGKTTQSPEDRARQIGDATGVPFPFKIEFSVFLPDCHSAERFIHQRFKGQRCNERREFFRVLPSEAGNAALEVLDEQINEFLGEFAPDHSYIETDMVIDDGDIHHLANRLGVRPVEVVSAFYLVEPIEFRPAIDRWKKKVSERRLAREAQAKTTQPMGDE